MLIKDYFYLNIILRGRNWCLCDFPFALIEKATQ